MYLPVDGADDGGAHVHAGDEAVLKVMMEDEGLQQGREEHEAGQRVPPPVRNTFGFNERDQHPVEVKEGDTESATGWTAQGTRR